MENKNKDRKDFFNLEKHADEYIYDYLHHEDTNWSGEL
jgi:hypothetical protein